MTVETAVDPVSLICTSCGALPGESCKTGEGTQEAHMAHGRRSLDRPSRPWPTHKDS